MASSASVNPGDEIRHHFRPLIKIYKDGRVERLVGKDILPASVDPETGVQSKDVVVSPGTTVSARLYLPKNADPSQKLPLLVYYHGGGFLVESAFSPTYHNHLNTIVANSNVIAVSVNYRLAPEHPLPAAYDDSWLALKWVASNPEEEWITRYADLDRVYLGGDSAGGNIAHNIAIRAGSENLDTITIRGLFLNCPFFWGVEPIGNEMILFPHNHETELWHCVCPETTGCDDPRINPGTDPKLSRIGCKRILVYVAEKDVLRERGGWYYKDALRKCGWDGEIEVVDVEGEIHVFSVLSPRSENSKAMIEKVAAFLNH